MSRNKNTNKKETKYIGVSIGIDELEQIEHIVSEMNMTKSQYFRNCIKESINNGSNKPALSTGMVEMMIFMQNNKENMNTEVYDHVMKQLSVITKYL